MFFANTDTIIADFNQNMFSISIVHAGRDGAILLSIFDGIFNKISNTCLIFSLSAKTISGDSHPFLIVQRIFRLFSHDRNTFKNLSHQVLDNEILF